MNDKAVYGLHQEKTMKPLTGVVIMRPNLSLLKLSCLEFDQILADPLFHNYCLTVTVIAGPNKPLSLIEPAEWAKMREFYVIILNHLN